MLKLGCILPKLVKICRHKSTDVKICAFMEAEKDLIEEIRETVVGGPSIVFTRKAVVDKNFIRKSTNICKSFVSNDASQLYFYSMCQTMPTGLYTRRISIQKRVDTCLDKTSSVALKKGSSPIFKKKTRM